MTTDNNITVLRQKTTNESDSYFVVRCTEHPAEDLERNWSAACGGFLNPNYFEPDCETREEADLAISESIENGYTPSEMRFHGAYDAFVEVHYEGLGAWELDAENLEEAIEEAMNTNGVDLVCTLGSGNGHFYKEDCLSYIQVSENIYIFEIAC